MNVIDIFFLGKAVCVKHGVGRLCFSVPSKDTDATENSWTKEIKVSVQLRKMSTIDTGCQNDWFLSKRQLFYVVCGLFLFEICFFFQEDTPVQTSSAYEASSSTASYSRFLEGWVETKGRLTMITDIESCKKRVYHSKTGINAEKQ